MEYVIGLVNNSEFDVDGDIVVCDAAIQQVVKLEDYKNVKFLGRGGTDFRPFFEHAEKMQPQPDAMIIFTDLYGSFPSVPPPCLVLWIVNHDDFDVEVPFGKKIHFK